MSRRFFYNFDPPQNKPVSGSELLLTIQEIQDAGIYEVLQMPGPAFGSWEFLETLLEPCPYFVFREPLGQSREVKVALSGLFGRFVARAYLQRYHDLSVFVHLGPSKITLNNGPQIEIVRRKPGDLPDWVACTNSFHDLTVAEAKGSHDRTGPEKTLSRAWNQAGRIDILVNGHRATLKRLAIVTRWGVATGGPWMPCLSVRDPVDEGDQLEPGDEDAIFLGLYRYHVANLISSLGWGELAELLRTLTSMPEGRQQRETARRANDLLGTASMGASRSGAGDMERGLIGGIVTRAGPLTEVALEDREALSRLNLNPVFVGIERELLRATINGDPSSIREALAGRQTSEGTARSDRAGGWIVPLGDEDPEQYHP